jgi:hypothetical protein
MCAHPDRDFPTDSQTHAAMHFLQFDVAAASKLVATEEVATRRVTGRAGKCVSRSLEVAPDDYGWDRFTRPDDIDILYDNGGQQLHFNETG